LDEAAARQFQCDQEEGAEAYEDTLEVQDYFDSGEETRQHDGWPVSGQLPGSFQAVPQWWPGKDAGAGRGQVQSSSRQLEEEVWEAARDGMPGIVPRATPPMRQALQVRADQGGASKVPPTPSVASRLRQVADFVFGTAVATSVHSGPVPARQQATTGVGGVPRVRLSTVSPSAGYATPEGRQESGRRTAEAQPQQEQRGFTAGRERQEVPRIPLTAGRKLAIWAWGGCVDHTKWVREKGQAREAFSVVLAAMREGDEDLLCAFDHEDFEARLRRSLRGAIGSFTQAAFKDLLEFFREEYVLILERKEAARARRMQEEAQPAPPASAVSSEPESEVEDVGKNWSLEKVACFKWSEIRA